MSVVRVQRKKKDFFVAKTEALNQKELSFKAKGLWAYAMSRPDDWQFVVEHLVTVSKEKNTAIYSALNELIEAGYCLRDQKKGEKGRWNKTDYVIFETLEDAEEFKKSLPLSGFPHADNPRPDNQRLLSIDPKLSNERILNTSSSEVDKKKTGPSAQASALAEEFYFTLKDAHGEDFKKPNLEKWAKDFDVWLRMEKLETSIIRKVMNWAVNDVFWKSNILSPSKLRKQFLTLKLQMQRPEQNSNRKQSEPKKDFETWKKEQESAPSPSENGLNLQALLE